MTTTLLFVTAKMPITRINKFLTDCQSIKDLVENSMYGLVRDDSVSLNDVDIPGTEPPVKEFESSYIGATDNDLWKTLDRYRKEESEKDHAGYLVDNTIIALDSVSKEQDTILMLYRGESGRSGKWRVPFSFLPAVTADLPDEEDTYMRPGMVDKEKILNMKKIKEALGANWKYERA